MSLVAKTSIGPGIHISTTRFYLYLWLGKAVYLAFGNPIQLDFSTWTGSLTITLGKRNPDFPKLPWFRYQGKILGNRRRAIDFHAWLATKYYPEETRQFFGIEGV